MSHILIPALCGFLGGLVAVAVGFFLVYRILPASGYLQISRDGGGPEMYKDVEVLEHASRPQGLYIRFRNTGSKPTEMALFRVRGYKEGRLWAELEETVYAETSPGAEQEAILKLRDYRDGSKTFDLSDCRIEVTFVSAYVASTNRTTA